MNDQLNFFFYGTLMSSGSRSRWIDDLAEPVGPASVRGDLYAVGMGGFPALVNGSGTVLGQLWRAYAPEFLPELFHRLDAIEGYRPYDPASSMYLREDRALLTPEDASAWLYVWNYGYNGLQPIPSGDWREYRRAEELMWS